MNICFIPHVTSPSCGPDIPLCTPSLGTLKLSIYLNIRGTLLVAQLVEALRYKSEGRGFDS